MIFSQIYYLESWERERERQKSLKYNFQLKVIKTKLLILNTKLILKY